MRAPCTTVLPAALVLSFTAAAFAGPTDPPAGPVGPTYKTLNEVEPRIAINQANTPGDSDATPSSFKITQRGSYYLTGNLNGIAAKNVIEIAADNVTLDLSGFSIIGGADAVLITANSPRSNIAIRNGMIAGCSQEGINALLTQGAVVEDISVQSCTGGGIYAGADARISRCNVLHCLIGISAEESGRIRDCTASKNTQSGIVLHDGGTVESCTIASNGFRGVNAYNEATIRDCRISHNGESGIDALADCSVEHCTLTYNSNTGLTATDRCAVRASTITANTDLGINCNNDLTADQCIVSFNGASGIYAYDRTSVHACTIPGNAQVGIVSSEECDITGNTINGNANGGINVYGSRGRVTDNTLSRNGPAGIFITNVGTPAAYNLVVRNYSVGHQQGLNLFLSSGNNSGATLHQPGVNFNSSNPWSNITD